MAYQLPILAKACQRLRADLEAVVRDFPRFHRYEVGTDIRQQMRKVQGLVARAWSEKDLRPRRFWIDRLVAEIDVLKHDLQAAQDVRAFNGFKRFELVYRQAEDIGRQAGGWKRQSKHPSAQNAEGRRAVPQRGQILSTRATPDGVNA